MKYRKKLRRKGREAKNKKPPKNQIFFFMEKIGGKKCWRENRQWKVEEKMIREPEKENKNKQQNNTKDMKDYFGYCSCIEVGHEYRKLWLIHCPRGPGNDNL